MSGEKSMRRKMKAILIITLFLAISTFISGCIDESTNESANLLSLDESDQIVGYWRFEEQYEWDDLINQVVDSSGNGLTGIANGTNHASPGKIRSQCAQFNSSIDRIDITNNELLEPDHVSVEAWVKSSNPGTFGYIVSKGGVGNQYSSYALYTDGNGGISFYITSPSNTIKSSNPGTAIWDNTWHHVAGTFDGSSVRLYVDGSEIGDGTPTNTTIRYNLTSGNDLTIGNYLLDHPLPFNGLIDDVVIWDEALSSESIYQHYLLGTTNKSTAYTPSMASLSDAREKLRTFLEPYTQQDILAIQGSNITIQDRLIINLVRSQVTNVNDIETISDENITESIIQDYSVLVLIGSQRTNQYTEKVLSNHDVEIESYLFASPFMLMLGHDTTIDKDILTLYTASELYNLENKAAERSPLAGVMDKKYVPMIATATSILALYLWNIFGNTVFEFLFDFTSEKVQDHAMEKRRKGKRKPLKQTSRRNIILKELAGIILAVLVFSTAMSWTWSSQLSEFYTAFLINLLVISLIFTIKELLRVYVSKRKKIQTEHVFWPFGALLTIGSTVLGNTFSLASYTYYDDVDDMKRYGKMYFYIFLSVYLFSVLTFILNFLFPSVIFQMMFVFAIMSVFIDMTPVEPMDGHDVKSWNFNIWLLFYILVACSYLIMNFTIFI